MASARPPFPVVNLAAAFLAGRWTARSLLARGKQAWPETGQWMRGVVRRLVQTFAVPPPTDELLRVLLQISWRQAYRGLGRCYFGRTAMTPAGAPAAAWPLPELTTAGQLAAWLDVAPGQLDWLADVRGWTGKQASTKLRHYVCTWRARRRGRSRLIE